MAEWFLVNIAAEEGRHASQRNAMLVSANDPAHALVLANKAADDSGDGERYGEAYEVTSLADVSGVLDDGTGATLFAPGAVVPIRGIAVHGLATQRGLIPK